MKEAAFLKINAAKWERFEQVLSSTQTADPDMLAELFIQLTDDLSFARTFYPTSNTTKYLNSLTVKVHQAIYRNKKEERGRIVTFWKYELPALFYHSHRELLVSFVIFALAALIGAVSAAHDDTFVRLILGDGYVNMTLENIAKGDPMGVYKHGSSSLMFMRITLNNIMVAFRTFASGVIFSVGTMFFLMYNGIMLGSFQYFFYQKGALLPSLLTIWIHGTLEISSIVIAGCSGLVIGNSILFPGTYTRRASFMRGAKQGVKIVVGLVPIFIIAGFLESFITRHTEMPVALSLFIIFGSLAFILWYFILYPIQLHRRNHGTDATIQLSSGT